MKKIKQAIRTVRHKLARATLGITRSERRIRHFKHTLANTRPTSAAHRRARLHLDAAESNLKKLRDRHVYLQLLFKGDQRRKHQWLKNHPDPKPAANLVTFDGHTLPGWIADVAGKARAAGAWHGYTISGYRSPAYSASLCEAMCGAPSCPGRCAGASSNHSCPPTHTGVPHEGAIDASDAGNLRAYAQSHGVPLYNHLPSDYPHSSASGY